MEDKSTNRKEYIDVLRILACAAVVMLHVAGNYGGVFKTDSFTWEICNIYDSCVRWAVPVFVMISGSLFLANDKPLNAILRENVLRLIAAYAIWSTVYGLRSFIVYDMSIKGLIYEIVSGHFHMWYIPMLIGLYLIVPLLRPIARDAFLSKYFLFLAVCYAYLAPQVMGVLEVFLPQKVCVFGSRLIDSMQIMIVLGYSSYYVLGYRLSRSSMSISRPILLLILFFTVLLTAAGTHVLSVLSGSPTQLMYGNLTINVFAQSVVVFMLFRSEERALAGLPESGRRLIRIISKTTFGIYLVHPLIIDAVDLFLEMHAIEVGPIALVPLVTLVVTVISFAVSYSISKLPVLKDWAI